MQQQRFRDFDQAIKINSSFTQAFNDRGLAYVSKGETDRAIEDFNQAIKLNPKLALAFSARGNSLASKAEYDKAIADLTQALSIVTPQTPPALVVLVYAALGDGYHKTDQHAKAREVWADGALKFPDDDGLKQRLESEGHALAVIVTHALSAGRRVNTTLKGLLPIA